MKTLIKLLLPIFTIALIFACEGPQGLVGPVGATGAKGDLGATGAAGKDGTNGTNGAVGATGAIGTANVIYSPWIARPFPGTGVGERIWTGSGFPTVNAPNFPNWMVSNPEPKITKDIVDKGVVLVYYRAIPTNTNAEALPFSTQSVAGNGVPISMLINFTINEGVLFIKVSNTELVQANGTFGLPRENALFRYVIIPGGIANGRLKNVDLKNYEAVKLAFNIVD